MKYDFCQVNVFANAVFGGNPLAVFPDASGMDATLMLKIAREMNLSETTFVFPSSVQGVDFDIRIFTPGKEIPFGGHPVIGTAHVLQIAGKTGRDSICLGTKIGPITVKLDGGIFMMRQALPVFAQCDFSRAQLAKALTLDPEEIDSRWPPQIVSTGFPAIFLPLKSPETLGRIKLNLARLENILKKVDMIYAFALGKLGETAEIHVRSFAPFIGIHEDPATGSAGGALGAYLVRHGFIPTEYFSKIHIKQGFEMGRPSTIKVKIQEADGQIKSVQVGGNSLLVIQGSIML